MARIPFLSRFQKKENAKLVITSISLRFMGAVHGIKGISSNSSTFYVNIPFQNKMGSNLLPGNLRGPPMKINGIKVSQPFMLLEVQPKLPAEVQFMDKAVFRLKLQGPNINYEGPLSVTINDEPEETISLNIRTIAMIRGKERAELQNSSLRLTLQKGQIFKTELQMYNILKYNEKISRVSAAPPFKVESTDPAAPTALDKKDSYVMKIYVKAPDSNYTGDLEIIVE